MRKNKKFLLTLLAGFVFVVSLPLMAAYEAHVINVTAHIENALRVSPKQISFGTVFPQEYLEKPVFVTASDSFCEIDQRRVLNIDYKIVQKPKPIWEQTGVCVESAGKTFEDIDEARAYCHEHPENLDCCYPTLCPYLSKNPRYEDPSPYDDHGVPAFHDPSDPASIATGTINKDHDLADEWIINLAVPCFEGMCAQDYDEFVHSYNPDADPDDYTPPAELEDSDFGCDLWIEVTDVY